MDNKREFFRLTIYEAPITIFLDGKEYSGEIRDISGNGIGFHSKQDWELGTIVNLKFSIKEKEFRFKAEIVRKELGTLGRELYGCKFLEQKEKQKSELSSSLLRLQADRRK